MKQKWAARIKRKRLTSLHNGQKGRRQKVERKTGFETFENHPKVPANSRSALEEKLRRETCLSYTVCPTRYRT
jgi:hypothetical protein